MLDLHFRMFCNILHHGATFCAWMLSCKQWLKYFSVSIFCYTVLLEHPTVPKAQPSDGWFETDHSCFSICVFDPAVFHRSHCRFITEPNFFIIFFVIELWELLDCQTCSVLVVTFCTCFLLYKKIVLDVSFSDILVRGFCYPCLCYTFVLFCMKSTICFRK